MIQPKPLLPNSKIGITCPAGYLDPEKAVYARKVLEDWGYQVEIGKTVGAVYNYFSGTDDQRRADLQQMLDDTDMGAIMMGRGGYGVSRIIDALDFTEFKKHPKWLIGFSDITVLHSHVLSNLDCASIHGPMCGAFTEESETSNYISSLKNMLLGKVTDYDFPALQGGREGTGKGILTGGNLAMLAHLTGSKSAVDFEGKILFIEDIGEHYYHVDRLMLNLKRSGALAKLSGLLIGDFSEMEDTARPFGQSLAELMMDKVAEYDYPVGFGFPAGHEAINFPLKLGAFHELQVGERLRLKELNVQPLLG